MDSYTRDSLLAVIPLVGIVVLLVVLARRMLRTKRVDAFEEIPFSRPPAVLEPDVFQALGSVEGVGVAQAGPGAFRVTIRRTPPWVIVPVILLFPLGLLCLLFTQDVTMSVWIAESPTGSSVRVTGPTEQHILGRVLRALSLVPVA